MEESKNAHQDQSQAIFTTLMRGKANTPATQASLADTLSAVEAWIEEERKLEETFDAVSLSLYLAKVHITHAFCPNHR
jgi:hypothetical protein